MIRGGQVNFQYEYERDLVGSLLLYVTATISDYHPAVYYQRNGDPGWPEEGGEVEDLEVTFEDGTFMNPIPDRLALALSERARIILSEEQ